MAIRFDDSHRRFSGTMVSLLRNDLPCRFLTIMPDKPDSLIHFFSTFLLEWRRSLTGENGGSGGFDITLCHPSPIRTPGSHVDLLRLVGSPLEIVAINRSDPSDERYVPYLDILSELLLGEYTPRIVEGKRPRVAQNYAKKRSEDSLHFFLGHTIARGKDAVFLVFLSIPTHC